MGYRKITVDGKEYLYTIGKQYLKIRGVGVVNIWEGPMLDGVGEKWEAPKVTPERIAEIIRNPRAWVLGKTSPT